MTTNKEGAHALTSRVRPSAQELLKRLNRAAERLEQASDQAITRRAQRQLDHDNLVRANMALMATRQEITLDLNDLIARLRALLDEA